MEHFDTMTGHGHEQVVYFQYRPAGLKAIVAIHNTQLGPALGGLRMWPYATEEDALRDVLRLSEDMTYKAAVAGLNLGGGKAVVIGNPETDKSEALFRTLGRFIGSLGNRYITAEDVGTTVDDMEYILQETDRVVGVHPVHGGSGDPSPFTAFGTMQGIIACLERKYGHKDASELSFAVQGAGQAGMHLIERLHQAGAKIFFSDINGRCVEEAVDRFGAEAVPMDEIYDVDANVFSPCAMSGVINADTLPRLKFDIVAGSGNNQLESEAFGTELEKRGILYAPDFAISAGGLINAATELQGYNAERAYQAVANIYRTISRIFTIADRDGIPSWQAAKRLALDRIESVAQSRGPYNKGHIAQPPGPVPRS